MKKPHYGWLVAIASSIVLFCAIGLTVSCMIMYFPYLRDAYGLSAIDTSRLITIRNSATFISLFTVNRLVRQIDLRYTMMIGMLCAFATYAILAFANSYSALLAGMVFAGLAHCYGGMVPASALINRWFRTNKGVALSIVAVGSGIAVMVMPPIITSVIDNMGLKTSFLMVMVVVIFCTVLSFVIIRNDPKNKGLLPVNKVDDINEIENRVACAGARSSLINKVDETSKTEKAASRQKNPGYSGDKFTERAFIFWIVLIGTSIYGMGQHWALLHSEFDFTPMNISLLVSFSGIVITVSKLIYGFCTDRIGARITGWFFMSMIVAGGILACFIALRSMPLALLATFFVHFGFSVGTVGLSLFAADLYTQNEYLRIVQNFNISYAVGSVLASEVTGYVTQVTGSYIPAYVIHMVLAVLAMLICILAYLRIMKKANIPEVAIYKEVQGRA